jgi:hypothetical protein
MAEIPAGTPLRLAPDAQLTATALHRKGILHKNSGICTKRVAIVRLHAGTRSVRLSRGLLDFWTV